MLLQVIKSAKEVMKKQYNGFVKVWMLNNEPVSHQDKEKVKIP
jgi:hypothetical protein